MGGDRRGPVVAQTAIGMAPRPACVDSVAPQTRPRESARICHPLPRFVGPVLHHPPALAPRNHSADPAARE